MKLTSDLIYGFTGSVLSSRFDEPAPSPECHKEWWDLCCSEHKYVAIAAPRGHAKSTAVSKSYVLACLLFRFRDYCIIISDTFSQSVQFVQELKRELSSNEDLKSLFKIKSFPSDREDDFICEFEDGVQFRVRGLGTEQKIRGLLWEGKRPNLVVGDDLENDEIVQNPERREKARNWLLNAVLPALSKRGLVRLVGTILHMDSLLERFMPKDHDPNTIHEELRTYTKKPVGGWMSARYWAHTEDFSKILWPIKWDEKRLKEIRHIFESQGNSEGYYQEYLNRPIDPSHAFFRKDDFLEMSEKERQMVNQDFTTYVSMDLAISTKNKRDYSVFVVGGMDVNGMLYIRRVIRDRLDSKDIIDTIFKLHAQYQPALMILETGTIEKSLGPFIRSEMMKRGQFPSLHTETPTIDKRQRAQAIRARMRSGGVKFDKSKEWYTTLEQEMLRFDRDAHDDQVDAMAWMGLVLDRMMEAPTVKQREREAFDEENAQYMEHADFDNGRNYLTGY